ncbi:MAG: hypothetical protein K0B81_02655 [Candidatus Cloacimonetes bacterium]|nr:hypothetical protein [Candidatus Cloacimonadota bacterium]
MKLLNEELRKRYEERRNDKGSLWISWLIRIFLLILVVLIIRYFTDLNVLFFTDIFRSPKTEEATNNYENSFYE